MSPIASPPESARAPEPYKFFGPHLGIAYGTRALMESWRPYKVRPAPDNPLGKRFETGTQAYELLAGFVAAVEYIESLGWDDIVAWERELGELGERGFAVWWGNYNALEVMKRLGLEDDGGAVRVGFVHYNTPDEVDRLLAELARME